MAGRIDNGMDAIRRIVSRFVEVRPGEGRALAWAFLYFFTLLTGYYVLRPVREEMGIRGGVKALPWLFSATFTAMCVALPIYGWVVGRFERRRIVPIVYRFFLLNLVAFWALFAAGVGGEALPRAFYVWTAVYNLFVVSIFWSVLADLFKSEQARRLFGFVAAGGTAGAICGPIIAGSLVTVVGPLHLLLVSALLLEASVRCMRGLFHAVPEDARASRESPIGGGVFDGLTDVIRSPYLLGIAAQTLFYACVSTFLYLQQQTIVADALSDSAERTRLFAMADLLVNAVALALQTFVTGAVLSRLGLFAGLAAVPIAGAIGASALAAVPAMIAVVVVNALRRGVHYGIEKPARETLFTAVADAEKYKAKSLIDTVVYRGADAASGMAYAGLQAIGLALRPIFLAAVPLALAGLALARWLAKRHERLADQRTTTEESS
ncbi:MFS transporter [bacterium]|nr:MFS transporter [bacterium]